MKPWSKLLGGKQKASAAPVQVQIPQHPPSHHQSHLSPPQPQPHLRREQDEQAHHHPHDLWAQQPLKQQQQFLSGTETGPGTATGPLSTTASGTGTGLHKTSPPSVDAAYEDSAVVEDDSIEDEFRRGMQEVHEMRDKYEGLLGIAVQAQQRSAELSGSLHELASFVEDAFGRMHEGDIGAVFLQVAAAQEGIARLFHTFSEHVGETIVGPTETLLAELAQVEETKVLYEEKRHVYGQLVLAAKAKQRQGHRKGVGTSGKVEEESGEAQRGRDDGSRAKAGKGPGDVCGGGEEPEGLQGREEVQAKEEFDEIAMTLGCRILNLEQQRPRRLLTQALRYLTAKRRLFREGAEQLLQVDPLVRHLMQQLNATERQILAELLGADLEGEEARVGGGQGEGAHDRGSEGSGSDTDGRGPRDGRLSTLPLAPLSGAQAEGAGGEDDEEEEDEDEEEEDEEEEAFFPPRQIPGLAKSMVDGPRKPFGVLAEAPGGPSTGGASGLLGARKPFVSHSAPLGPGAGLRAGGIPGLHPHHPLLLSSHPPVAHVLPTSPSQLTQQHAQQQQQQQQGFPQGHPPIGPSPLKAVLHSGAPKQAPRSGAPVASQGGGKAGSPQAEGTGEGGKGGRGSVAQGAPKLPGSSLGLLTMSGPITSSQPLFAPRLAHKSPVPLFSVHMSGPLPSPSAVEQEHYHQQLHQQQAGAQAKGAPPKGLHEAAQGSAGEPVGGQGQGQAQGLELGRRQKSLSPETSPGQADEERRTAGAAKGDKGPSPVGAPSRTVSMSGPITMGSGGEHWTGVAKSMTSLGAEDGAAHDLLGPFAKPLMGVGAVSRSGEGIRSSGVALNAGSRDDLEMPWQSQQRQQQLLMQQQASQRRRPVSGPIPKGSAGLMLSGYAVAKGPGGGGAAIPLQQGQGLGLGQGLVYEPEQGLPQGQDGHPEEAHELHRLPPPPLPATGLAPAVGAATGAGVGAGPGQASSVPSKGVAASALGVRQAEDGAHRSDVAGTDAVWTAPVPGVVGGAGREREGVPGLGAGAALVAGGLATGAGAGPEVGVGVAGIPRAPGGAKGGSGGAKVKGGGGAGASAPLKGPPGLAPLSTAALRQQQQHAAIQQVFHQQQQQQPAAIQQVFHQQQQQQQHAAIQQVFHHQQPQQQFLQRQGQAGGKGGEAQLQAQVPQGEHGEQGQAQGASGSGLSARAMLGRAGLGVSRNPSVPTIYSEGSDEGESIAGSSVADSPSISSASSPRPPQEDLAMLYRGGGHEGIQYRPHARPPMGGLPPSSSPLLPPSASASASPNVTARAPASAVLPAPNVALSSGAPAAPPSSLRAAFPSSATVPLPGPPALAAGLSAARAGLGVGSGYRGGGASAEASVSSSSAAAGTSTGSAVARSLGGAGLAAGGARDREEDSRMRAGRAAAVGSSPPHAQESLLASAPLQRGGPALSGGSFRTYSEASVEKDEPGLSC